MSCVSVSPCPPHTRARTRRHWRRQQARSFPRTLYDQRCFSQTGSEQLRQWRWTCPTLTATELTCHQRRAPNQHELFKTESTLQTFQPNPEFVPWDGRLRTHLSSGPNFWSTGFSGNSGVTAVHLGLKIKWAKSEKHCARMTVLVCCGAVSKWNKPNERVKFPSLSNQVPWLLWCQSSQT